jgi:hypothetical protein
MHIDVDHEELELRGGDESKPDFRPFRALQEVPPEPRLALARVPRPGRTDPARRPSLQRQEPPRRGGLLASLSSGEPFLGKETHPATALLVTEEDDSVLRQRAEVIGTLELDGSYISRTSGVMQYGWHELVTAAADEAILAGHSLLVFDTFPGLAKLAGQQENDAGAITERLTPLVQAAGLGLSVLFLHHMNTYGQPRGSKALRGIVDIMLSLHRDKDTRFRLDAESRYPTATPTQLRGRLIKGPERWR